MSRKMSHKRITFTLNRSTLKLCAAMTRRLFSHKHWLHCNRENEDPDRARRIQLLREQERRLAEQVERERLIVERMRWEKLALEKAIRDKMAAKKA